MKFCDEIIQNHLLAGGEVKRVNENTGYRSMRIGDDYQLDRDDLIADDWEIVVPEYDWDKIIEDKILCLFSDHKGFKYNIFSTLRMRDNNFYYTDNGTTYKYCKPFNPAEFNIAKDLKDYEK